MSTADGAAAFESTKNSIVRLFEQSFNGAWTNVIYAAKTLAQDSSVDQVLAETRDGRKWGCWHFAAAGGNVSVLQHLFEMLKCEGPSWLVVPDLSQDETEQGQTVLHLAAAHGHQEACEWLIQHGCNLNVRSTVDRTTPLLCAIENEHISIVELLLERGADASLPRQRPNCPEETPLLVAVSQADSAMAYRLAELLLTHGATQHESTSEPRAPPPLNMAAARGHLQLVELFLRHGAHVNAVDAEGYSALQCAAECGYVDICRRLLDNKADVNYSGRGKTALDFATGFPSVMDLLIQRGGRFSCFLEQCPSTLGTSYALMSNVNSQSCDSETKSTAAHVDISNEEDPGAASSAYEDDAVLSRSNICFNAASGTDVGNDVDRRLLASAATSAIKEAQNLLQQDPVAAVAVLRAAILKVPIAQETRRLRALLYTNLSTAYLLAAAVAKALRAAELAEEHQQHWLPALSCKLEALKAAHSWEGAAIVAWECRVLSPAGSEKSSSYMREFEDIITRARLKSQKES